MAKKDDETKAQDEKDDLAAKDGLVKMVKSGEEPLHVHPTTVQAHRAAGWKPAAG